MMNAQARSRLTRLLDPGENPCMVCGDGKPYLGICHACFSRFHNTLDIVKVHAAAVEWCERK